MMNAHKFTPLQALPKIRQYCAFQERCHSEVKEKLFSYGLFYRDVEELISKMVEENFLNEERFAIHYAGGKFRIKQWGKLKITYRLRQKQVSAYCIKKALQAIDDSDYINTLTKLAATRLKALEKEKNKYLKKKKMQEHLTGKGYEPGLVSDVLKDLVPL